MQVMVSPFEQLIAFSLIAVAIFLSWILDIKYEAYTTIPFILPEEDNSYLKKCEARKQSVRIYVFVWWLGAIFQVGLMSVGGYLIFSTQGGVTFFILFGFFRLTSGVIYFRRVTLDTLGDFEGYLEAKSLIMPLTEMFLTLNIDRCIEEGLLEQEDYERLLTHLSKRTDTIGSIAKQLLAK